MVGCMKHEEENEAAVIKVVDQRAVKKYKNEVISTHLTIQLVCMVGSVFYPQNFIR